MQPEDYRKLREAYQRGHFDRVVATADGLAATFDRDPNRRPFVPAIALMKGAALAELDDYVGACEFLEYGLDRFDEDDSSHFREVADADWFALRLVELQTLIGRYGEAWSRLTLLEDPAKPHPTRLAAIRGRAALNTTRGDYEGAHQLLNAALTVAERINSQFLATAVEADRAVVLGMQGRLLEAIALADRTFEKLARPAAGGRGVWSARSTAAIALTLSRLCLDAGNLGDGERFLLHGTSATERAPSSYFSAQLDLTISSLWRAQGSAGTAEPLCREAAQTFARLGCRPAEAQATLELAKLAEARGMATSAIPLLERARSEFSYLGHARELRETERLLQLAAAADVDPFLPPDDTAFRPPTPPPRRTPTGRSASTPPRRR